MDSDPVAKDRLEDGVDECGATSVLVEEMARNPGLEARVRRKTDKNFLMLLCFLCE